MKHQKSKIAIIGAGPAGSTMARVLQQHDIPCEIFEREVSIETRDQGGTLDMKVDSGQKALRLAGVYDEFIKLARPEGQDGRTLDFNGNVLFEQSAPPDEQAAPEINRGELRAILLNGLQPGTVHWGMDVQAIESDQAGAQIVHFANGEIRKFDLVVGGDGAWSKARKALSPANPIYSGVVFVEVGFDDVDKKNPAIAAMTGNGSMFAVGASRIIVAQRNAGNHIRVYLAFHAPMEWVHEVKAKESNPVEMRKILNEQFSGWSKELLAFIDKCEDSFTIRPIFALPVPHTWQHKKGLTLIGDSAHLMSPFSGMGANLAMLDGAELAQCIVEHDDLDVAVQQYESVMFPRSIEHAEGAAEGLRGALSEDAVREVSEHMKEVAEKNAPQL